jgi:hypothetical protein
MNGVRERLVQSLHELRDRGKRLAELNRELLKAEMKVLAARYGAAIAMIVLAALLGFFGFGFLLATGAIALDLVLPLWASVLIVAVLLFLLAAILVAIARSQITAAKNPVPDKAAAEAKATADALKAGLQTVGRRGKSAAKAAAGETAAAAGSRVRSAGARVPRPGGREQAAGAAATAPTAADAAVEPDVGAQTETTSGTPPLKHADGPLKHASAASLEQTGLSPAIPADAGSSAAADADASNQTPPESSGGERAPD